MSNILVANPGYHKVIFEYRVPEIFDRNPRDGELVPKLFRAVIMGGSQVRFKPNDLSDTQLQSIIEQLERYGAVPSSEVRSMSVIVPGSSPIRRTLIYSIETPIKSDHMDEGREADEKIRQAVSDREAEASGCATIPPNIDPYMANVMRQTQNESSMHIQQVTSLEGKEPRSQKGGIDKTITVSKNAGKRERKVG